MSEPRPVTVPCKVCGQAPRHSIHVERTGRRSWMTASHGLCDEHDYQPDKSSLEAVAVELATRLCEWRAYFDDATAGRPAYGPILARTKEALSRARELGLLPTAQPSTSTGDRQP